MAHPPAQAVAFSEARRYLAALNNASNDAAFISTFSMLWLHLEHIEPRSLAANAPLGPASLDRLLKEYGRRTSNQILHGDPRAARALWTVTERSTTASSAEMWHRVGVSRSWYIAQVHNMIHLLYVQLLNGQLDRAPQLAHMPPANEQTLAEVLGIDGLTVIAEGFVRWADSEYRLLSHSRVNSVELTQRAAFVLGLVSATHMRFQRCTGVLSGGMMPYRQLGPVRQQLFTLIRSRLGS